MLVMVRVDWCALVSGWWCGMESGGSGTRVLTKLVFIGMSVEVVVLRLRVLRCLGWWWIGHVLSKTGRSMFGK